jgi:hypothetical protein
LSVTGDRGMFFFRVLKFSFIFKHQPLLASSLYSDFFQRHRILSTGLLNQECLNNRLIMGFNNRFILSFNVECGPLVSNVKILSILSGITSIWCIMLLVTLKFVSDWWQGDVFFSGKHQPLLASSLYSDFFQRHRILSTGLLNQECLNNRLIMGFNNRLILSFTNI